MPFQNGFSTGLFNGFYVYVFGMSFCITPAKKKPDIDIFNSVIDQFNAVVST